MTAEADHPQERARRDWARLRDAINNETHWVFLTDDARAANTLSRSAAGAIFVEVVVVLGLKAGGRLSEVHSVNATFGSPGWIGRLFLTDHLLAFEMTSIVLLIAAVGGVILGEQTKRRSDGAVEQMP